MPLRWGAPGAPGARPGGIRRSDPPGTGEGRGVMDIAFCYESVLPTRGGCETYIAALARRLAADGHEVHLYARDWDEEALPAALVYHRITLPRRPRFLRPWYFAAACHEALAGAPHQVSVGFDKITGMDVLYPQG